MDAGHELELGGALSSFPPGTSSTVPTTAGMTWKALDRATDPRDLGTDTEYTDRIDVAPGQQYRYRVFPVSITEGRSQDDFGLPATIEASAEEAEVPDPVTGLEVAANGQTGYTLTWNEVTVNGGHDDRWVTWFRSPVTTTTI